MSYHGVDIVRTQIARHRANYQKRGVRSFSVADLVLTPPPVTDLGYQRDVTLILCRQALQHLNAYDALRVLHQFSRSGASYLLTTTYRLSGYRQHREGWQPPGDPLWNADENFTPQLPGKSVVLFDLTRPPFSLGPMLTSQIENEQEYVDPASAAAASQSPSCTRGHREMLGLWPLPLKVRCAALPVEAFAGGAPCPRWVEKLLPGRKASPDAGSIWSAPLNVVMERAAMAAAPLTANRSEELRHWLENNRKPGECQLFNCNLKCRLDSRFHNDALWFGPPIRPISSISACAEVCGKTRRCTAFLHNKYRACYLLAGSNGKDLLSDEPQHGSVTCLHKGRRDHVLHE